MNTLGIQLDLLTIIIIWRFPVVFNSLLKFVSYAEQLAYPANETF